MKREGINYSTKTEMPSANEARTKKKREKKERESFVTDFTHDGRVGKFSLISH